MSGHRLAFRSPYYAVDGPIEYFFNTLQHELSLLLHQVRDENDLRLAVQQIIVDVNNFEGYFTNVFG